VPHIRGRVSGSRGGVKGWMVGSVYPSDAMGPVVVLKEPSMVSKPHHKAKQAI